MGTEERRGMKVFGSPAVTAQDEYFTEGIAEYYRQHPGTRPLVWGYVDSNEDIHIFFAEADALLEPAAEIVFDVTPAALTQRGALESSERVIGERIGQVVPRAGNISG